MPFSTSKWEFSNSSPDPKDVDWCVTEKCHGANFSFLCDGISITHARRNDILKEKEKFFGYKSMAEKHKDNVLNAYQTITNNQQLMQKYVTNENNDKVKYQLSQISIYGEMFGGFFPQQQRNQNGQKQVQNKQKQVPKKQKQAPNKQTPNKQKQVNNNNNSNNNNSNNNINDDNNPNRKRRRRRRRGKRGGKNNQKKNNQKQNNNDNNTNDNNTNDNNTNDNNTNEWITIGKKTQNKPQNKSTDEEKKDDTNQTDKNYVVQREILYCPGIEFYAFDIAVILQGEPAGNKQNGRRKKKKQNDDKNVNNDDDKDENDENDEFVIRKYMDYEDAIEIFKTSKFFYAKPLFVGSFEDCCKYDYEFKSKIPNWLGLKPLEKKYGNNLAEGIIVKPMKNIYYTLGQDTTLRRAVVKLKHPLFFERIGDFKRKFNDFEKNGKKKENENGDKDLTNINLMLDMMNVNRYQSVISKLGNPTPDNYDFFADKMVKDIFEDIVYIEENEINEWWESRILKKEQLLKYIEKKLQKKAMDIILDQK